MMLELVGAYQALSDDSPMADLCVFADRSRRCESKDQDTTVMLYDTMDMLCSGFIGVYAVFWQSRGRHTQGGCRMDGLRYFATGVVAGERRCVTVSTTQTNRGAEARV